MKTLLLDREKCIGCAICSQLAPTVFELDKSDGKALLCGQPMAAKQKSKDWIIEQYGVTQSQNQCPVGAIVIQ